MPSIIQTLCPEKLSFASTVAEYFSRPNIFPAHKARKHTMVDAMRTFWLFFLNQCFKKNLIIKQLSHSVAHCTHPTCIMSDCWQTLNSVKLVLQHHNNTPVETKTANVPTYNLWRFMFCSCSNFNVINAQWFLNKHIFIRIQMFCLSWCNVTHSMATVRKQLPLRYGQR